MASCMSLLSNQPQGKAIKVSVCLQKLTKIFLTNTNKNHKLQRQVCDLTILTKKLQSYNKQSRVVPTINLMPTKAKEFNKNLPERTTNSQKKHKPTKTQLKLLCMVVDVIPTKAQIVKTSFEI